jgi:hypothetical protein
MSRGQERCGEEEGAMTTFIMRRRYSSEAIKQISAERTTKAVGIVKERFLSKERNVA